VCTYVLVSVWSELDLSMLQESFNMVYSCVYTDQADLHVIYMKTIASVVAIPYDPTRWRSKLTVFPAREARVGDLVLIGCTYSS
jgi:hypothetical protein